MDYHFPVLPASDASQSQGGGQTHAARQGHIRGRVATATLNLGCFPPVLQQQICAVWLTFAEQGNLCSVNRQWYSVVGSMPVYRGILNNGGISMTSFSTPAAQVYAAIEANHRMCMSYMAEALQSVDRGGPGFRRMILLWDSSTEDVNHPCFLELKNRHMQSLWDRQLLGYPALPKMDSRLWSAFQRKAKTVEQQMDVLKRAVWGFCDKNALEFAQKEAIRIGELESLSASDRKKAEVLRDLVNFFLLPSRGTKSQTAWTTCQAHLETKEGSEALAALGLQGFVTLLDQQWLLTTNKWNRETENQSSHLRALTEDTIAQNLMQLYEDCNYSPHLRALAGITLAFQVSENRTNVIGIRDACNMLRRICKQELRPSIHQQAEMVLGSLLAGSRSLGTPHTNLDNAVLALRCLRPSGFDRLHGLVIDQEIWAKDTLVRLKVANLVPEAISRGMALEFAAALSTDKRCSIHQQRYHADVPYYLLSVLDLQVQPVLQHNPAGDSATFEEETQAWSQNLLGSNRRIEAGLKLAELYVSRLSRQQESFCAGYGMQMIDSLGEILISCNPTQGNQAKLLLVTIHLKTDSECISQEEAETYCRQVYESLDSSQVMRQQAIKLLARMR